ncbi:MAG: hypothetical protein RJP95_03405, partial [Pirellulales bacterium]
MKRLDASLITPVYVKQQENAPLPEDPVYYLLTSDNLYLCRNHPLYRSCVPAPLWPTELCPHATSLAPRFPLVPQHEFERICGFLGHVSDDRGAEAIALLAWDNVEGVVRTIVPRQVSAVGNGGWGTTYPIGVKYECPRDLPPHWTLFCDVHSHCELSAYASQTDIDDEENFTGLHIVVGRMHQEPPDFHVEAAVDGARFSFKISDVVAAYEGRASFPSEWL